VNENARSNSVPSFASCFSNGFQQEHVPFLNCLLIPSPHVRNMFHHCLICRVRDPIGVLTKHPRFPVARIPKVLACFVNPDHDAHARVAKPFGSVSGYCDFR